MPTLEEFGRRLGQLVTRFSWMTGLLAVVSCLAVSWGVTRSTFATDYKIFFAEDDPQRQAFDELETVFTKTDNIVFVVATDGDDIFTPSAIGAVQDLTAGGWTLPFASRVDSLTNYQISYAEDEDIVVEELASLPAAQMLPEDFDDARRRASGDPLLEGGLLAKDHRAAGVNVTLRLAGDSPTEVTEAADAARALAAAVSQEHPDVEIRISGMALMNEAFMEASIQDMMFIVPLMYGVMIVALAVLLRSALATACVVLIVALSCGVTLGLGGWLGYPLTPVTASAPTVVLTLAVADGVHLFKAMQGQLAAGQSPRDAVIEALRVNFRPILLTSLTTAIGFLCLNFAEAPPYWHLANMTAAGIVAAFVYSVTLLPVLLVAVKVKPPRAPAVSAPASLRTMQGLSGWVLRRHRAVLVLAGVATVALGLAATTLRSNDQFVEYFDESIAFRPDAEFMMDRLAGIYTVEYRVGAGAESAVSEPAYLRKLDAFATWLRDQPEVTHVYSYADIIKRINRNLHDDDPRAHRIPDTREAASQELMLYEMSLPMGLDLNDRVDIGRSSTRVSIILRDVSSAELRAFKERSEAWLVDNTPAFMHAKATSPVVIFTHLSHENTKSMMLGNFVSLLLISGCLVFALGSVRLGLLSLIPNLLPIVAGYGLWALMFGEINIVASIAGTVCLGIIVDDTIHFLSKYQLARRDHGATAAQAIASTYQTVGPALVATTIVLGFGFGVLTASGFEMNSVLGLLVVMVVGFALVVDLLVLPALLLLADRGQPSPK